ncbi:hypothetical protein LIER_25929 [Lithospermum erythrorhizon]|uniref:Retrovirus-related Pol polyprotein from transposon TNT 1-94 n=1 Tax=Lithospermum erythrorhizon TaxID=34254 RepID=A0AAV3R6L6_LITER
MFQSGLPKHFWGEAILTATYIANKLPTAILKWKTPYKKLYSRQLDINHMRIFGCLCFATVTGPNTNTPIEVDQDKIVVKIVVSHDDTAIQIVKEHNAKNIRHNTRLRTKSNWLNDYVSTAVTTQSKCYTSPHLPLAFSFVELPNSLTSTDGLIA